MNSRYANGPRGPGVHVMKAQAARFGILLRLRFRKIRKWVDYAQMLGKMEVQARRGLTFHLGLANDVAKGSTLHV